MFCNFSDTLSKSSCTDSASTFAYLCVCVIFVCPSIRDTFSIFAPFLSIYVAKVCRARCECSGVEIPAIAPRLFKCRL